MLVCSAPLIVQVLCSTSYLDRRPVDAICCGEPRIYNFVRLPNFGSSNVAIPTNASTWFGGNIWRFDENNPTNYAGKIVTITHNLNGVGDKKAQFGGDDRQVNISNYILYLYVPAGR